MVVMVVGGIYEVVRLVGGLKNDTQFITSAAITIPHHNNNINTPLQSSSSSSSSSSYSITAALATSGGEVILFHHGNNGSCNVFKIPWVNEDGRKPVALAFSPNAEWLLVASEDGTLFVVPIGGRLDPLSVRDQRFRTDDVLILPPNGSRAKPTSLVWWQTGVGDVSLGIIGTELGELSFIELISGREVGGTYITVPVIKLHICTDNSQDTSYLLITGTEDRQWRLVLEQKSTQYLFPLELFTPEFPHQQHQQQQQQQHGMGISGPLVRPGPPARSRLLGLKQLSVEKLQMLRQRLAEAKTGSRRKPLTENKGVDTNDIDEISSPATPPDHQQQSHQATVTPALSGATAEGPAGGGISGGISVGISAGDCGPTPMTPVPSQLPHAAMLPQHSAARPERMCRYIHDALATPQYARDRHLLAAHCKENDTLLVYSTDLEPTPLHVFKITPQVKHITLQDEIIFLAHQSSSKLSIVSTFFAASSKMDGTIDAKVNPVIQEIELSEDEDAKVNPVIQEIELSEDEVIISLHPTPPLIPHTDDDNNTASTRSSTSRRGSSRRSRRRNDDNDDDDDDDNADIPTHTWPNGCLIVTSKALYVCQTRMSVECLFMSLVLRVGDIDGANKLGVIFSLDPKLFEVAADVKLRARNFSAAIALYKHSRCPHVKCSIKFAAQGLVTEFLTYMGTLTSGVSGPDLGAEERRNLANLAILAYLYQLCRPVTQPRNPIAGTHSPGASTASTPIASTHSPGQHTPTQSPSKPPHPQQASLRNLLLFLRDNQHYDEVLALTFAAASWRWETLQYLAASRGLYLEKLRALLSPQASPVIDLLPPELKLEGPLVVARERDAGYLHCVSDPELRSVLLLRPSLARTHISLVLSLLPTLEVGTLRRLAELYNPTHPSIRPFLQTTNGRKPYPIPAVTSSLLPPYGSEEMVSVETIVETFLAIMTQLNRKRKWVYNPELLTYIPETKKQNVEPAASSAPVCVDNYDNQVLSGGYGHSAVLINGVIYTWGLNDYGVLGHGPKSLTKHKLTSGIQHTTLHNNDDMEVGQCNVGGGMGIHGSTTTSSCNGRGSSSNNNGSCSNNIIMDGTEPNIVSYLSHCHVFSVACGKNHTLAITDNGVYGWGSNKYGQLGTGYTGRHPRPILCTYFEGKPIMSVAAGQFHSLAVSKHGTLYTWGWGVHGQLGNGNVEDCLIPTPVKYLSKKKVIYADGGYAHSIAMTIDGSVYAWGCGTYGQIGNGGIIKVNLPQQVPLPKPATHITAGYFTNLAVTNDHKVYTWGNNPACLRVQAQLQRRHRSTQQQQQQQQKQQQEQKQEQDNTARDDIENRETPKDDEQKTEFETCGIGAKKIETDENISKTDENICETSARKTETSENIGETSENIRETSETISETSDRKTETDENISKTSEGIRETSENIRETSENIRETSENIRETSEGDSIMTLAEESEEVESSQGYRRQEEEGNVIKEGEEKNQESTGNVPRTVSANTVPSCDPSDLGHLLPQEVEMPPGFGAVRSMACGSQHCVLLTTHGALYIWGTNMAGQLGTGNRRQLLIPTRIMHDIYITNVTCGADFTLALQSQGHLWGWGSNFYSQLGRGAPGEEDKGQAGRVFMLRTTKRVLKVPHTVHSNCETPRPILGLPTPHPTAHHPHYAQPQTTPKPGHHSWLGEIRLDTITEPETAEKGQSSKVTGQLSQEKGHMSQEKSQLSQEKGQTSQVTGQTSQVKSQKVKGQDEVDDLKFGPLALRTALSFLHGSYSIKNVINMLREAEGHQALATLYTLERQYSQAMHHNLAALLKQSGDMFTKDLNGGILKAMKEGEGGEEGRKEGGKEKGGEKEKKEKKEMEKIETEEGMKEGETKKGGKEGRKEGEEEKMMKEGMKEGEENPAHDSNIADEKGTKKSLVGEAVRIIDHYLCLQTEESQTGMRLVLCEGIQLWLTHSLPLPQLEELLLTHLPRTVYPLALLLFGDGAPGDKDGAPSEEGGAPSEDGGALGEDAPRKDGDESRDPAMKVLGQLSTKFCLNLCTSVISHLQAGGGGGEYTEAVSQLAGVASTHTSTQDHRSSLYSDDASKLDAALDTLSKRGVGSINLTQSDVQALQDTHKTDSQDSKTEDVSKDGERKRVDGSRGSISGSSRQRSGSKVGKDVTDKDTVLFTCGHHFTKKDFKSRVLPEMETSVQTVPGLLGNTARVLLDQYHSDQPEMACPHCVLAHLTIKLTKHKQTN